MNNPLFSCVIPVKGDRPFFGEAIGSLKGQGLGDDLEIIVQDGGVGSGGVEELGWWICEVWNGFGSQMPDRAMR